MWGGNRTWKVQGTNTTTFTGLDSTTIHKNASNDYELLKEGKDVDSRFSVTLFRLDQSGAETSHVEKDGREAKGQQVGVGSGGMSPFHPNQGDALMIALSRADLRRFRLVARRCVPARHAQ